MIPTSLLHHVHATANELPPSVLEAVAKIMAGCSGMQLSPSHLGHLISVLPQARWRQVVTDLFQCWQAEAAHLSGEAIATALLTAGFCHTESRQNLSLELVWTGPDGHNIPLRRTEQVLLQLIQEAQQHLTLVSFAVYNVDEIAHALLAAMQRGVQVRIIAETAEDRTKPVPFGVQAGLGNLIAQTADVLTWDRAKRPTDENGRCGSLHVKCAIADQETLFITSANLTGYALSLNMELGILIRNVVCASQVVNQLNSLIAQEVLVISA